MITKENIKDVLITDRFKFKEEAGRYFRHYGSVDGGFDLSYNAAFGRFEYPKGVIADRNTTQDSHQQESFVVFLCVAQLFACGYQPWNIVLEGKNYSGIDKGYCDILIVPDNRNDKFKEDQYLIIECKTSDLSAKDDEFRKHWMKTLRNGDQLFRYFNTYRKAKYLCLYAADFPEYTKNGHKEYRFENIYNIISLVDNNEYLQTDSNLRSFDQLRKEQGSAEEFFNVWKQTYKQDFNTRGLLEEGIKPFEIGKKNYSLSDLKTVDEYSLEKKYYEFALILRKHTISSHENAFDKLINLFIAKIIDEKYNTHQLNLLWKGAAYDDYFSLQDRLNELYRIGMKEFFNDDVTFIENRKIDDAFKFLTSKADVARDTIKRYFRQIKYFNNNPFAFLDVHNEQLFFQNAVILKDVINMLQEIYLTSNTDNQFLGDLFEGFLNKGVHQSEGQFFTPIPIVRFLISSLPIKQLIEESSSAPRVIDYACGAGHFLTEYARQVKMVIDEKNKVIPRENRIDITPYFKNIVGIEKDYRLSKVSQVAAFMYGMDGIHIHFSDGLAKIADIKEHAFNVLVANPPYSVSGFLETLNEEERKNYRLTPYVSNIEKNNAIETFFIERASQLLDSRGVATIVLPSSILSKGGIYMRTRELILRTFDIISIVCLGPNTFGQTNTNTVALFLRRKALEPDESVQIANRVNEWFHGNMDDDEFYNDSSLLDTYINRMGYKRDDYLAMMRGKLTQSFLDTEMVQEYVKALNIQKQSKNSSSTALAAEAKKVRDDAQSYIKSRAYKDLSPSGKKDTKTLYTVRFIQEIEKEKLYYYLLAASNPQQVLIVQSPDDKKKEKSFLGYEWSNRKGNEGIHYLNISNTKKSSSDDEESEDDTLTQLKGVEGIVTPMFNPLDFNDESKINSLIRKNYNGEEFEIGEELESFVHGYDFTDILDFTRVEFDKTFRTNVEINYIIESKYPLIRLNDKEKFSISIGRRVLTSEIANAKDETNAIPVYSANVKTPFGYTNHSILESFEKDSVLWGIDGDWIVNYVEKNNPFYPTDHCGVIRVLDNEINSHYLSVVLSRIGQEHKFSRTYRASTERIKGVKIPLPPKNIQKKIAEECAEVDKELKDNVDKIVELREVITNIADRFYSVARRVPLGTLCSEPMYGANTPAYDGNPTFDFRYIRVTDINDDGCLNSEWKTAKEVEDKYILQDGDMLFARSGATAGKTFLYQDSYGKALYAGYLIKFHPDETKLMPEFLDLITRSTDYKQWTIKTRGGTAQPNINAQQFSSYMLPIIDIDIQREAVKEYRKYKQDLITAMTVVKNAQFRKQAILDKYLK